MRMQRFSQRDTLGDHARFLTSRRCLFCLSLCEDRIEISGSGKTELYIRRRHKTLVRFLIFGANTPLQQLGDFKIRTFVTRKSKRRIWMKRKMTRNWVRNRAIDQKSVVLCLLLELAIWQRYHLRPRHRVDAKGLQWRGGAAALNRAGEGRKESIRPSSAWRTSGRPGRSKPQRSSAAA